MVLAQKITISKHNIIIIKYCLEFVYGARFIIIIDVLSNYRVPVRFSYFFWGNVYKYTGMVPWMTWYTTGT